VRIDTHVYQGYVVPPHYDSLLAKLIVHANTRPAAIARLRRALSECVIEGVKTNLDFHRRLCEHPDYQAGLMDTRFVERMLKPV
jgi:acetyl-CoA carboxylase biotin carboxylase subunit